jgi:23S rRNA (guanosine2251-2'-O)-methyltransferase
MAPPQVLADDEELVAGRRPVEEAFVARRPARRLLVVPQRRAALEKLVLHATNLRIPIIEVEGGSLTALAGFDGHQGIALVVEPRRFAGMDDILALAATRNEPPFILVLDSLEDPHNVGSLLRSAEAAGVHGVIFPTHRQAPLSPSAVKASAGAVEHLLLCPVDDLAGALSDLHVRGVRIAGAEGDAPMTARQSDLRGPLAIVVGSEGQGLGPAVRRRCDMFMRIPMRGAVGSLNAAVAGSILLFEAVAQRDDGTAATGSAKHDAAPSGRTPAALPTDAAAPTDATADPAMPAPSMGEAGAATPASGDAERPTEEVAPTAAVKPPRRSRAKPASPTHTPGAPLDAEPSAAAVAEPVPAAEPTAGVPGKGTAKTKPKAATARAAVAAPAPEDAQAAASETARAAAPEEARAATPEAAAPVLKPRRAKATTTTAAPRTAGSTRTKRTAATPAQPAAEADDQDDELLPT